MKVRPDGYQNEVLDAAVTSPCLQSYERYDRIDWVAATPSLSSIITGVVFPILAIVALVLMIDIILSWVFGQWIGYFRSAPFWLVATMALPLALICTFAIAKIFIKISSKLGRANSLDSP